MGSYWRGRRNAEQIQVRHNYVVTTALPCRFNGFTLLQISDLHIDMNEGAIRLLAELLPDAPWRCPSLLSNAKEKSNSDTQVESSITMRIRRSCIVLDKVKAKQSVIAAIV
jgi:hypothetical protein